MLTPRLDKAEIDRLNLHALSGLIANRKRSKRLVRIAHAAADVLGYAGGVAYADLNALWLAYYGGDVDAIEAGCQPLRLQFDGSGDLQGSMAVAVLLGALHSRRGDFGAAERHFEQARALATETPDTLHKFMLYNRLGIDALNRGDTRSGPRNFLLALDIAERFGTAAHRVNSLSNLASSQHDLGNDEDAIPLLYEALDIINQEGLAHQQAIVSANLGMCLLATGKPAEALARVAPFFDAPDDDLSVCAFLLCIGAHGAILTGQLAQAQALLARGQAHARDSADLEEQMHGWLVQGMLDSVRQEPARALVALKQAHGMLGQTRNPFYQQQIFQGLAEINARLGKWKVAYGFLQQYQTHFEASSKSARDSRLLMRNLEREMRNLKEERDKALEAQAARESENQKLEHLNKELSHQIMHVNSLQDSLKEQAIRDHLTGLYNRRHFETCLNAVLHESSGRFPVAIVIIDLDFFKRVNDSFGHAFGDEVLVGFARLVEGQLRMSDMVCRYGGEEFCLLLREADSDIASNKIEAIAALYRQVLFQHGGNSLSGCTFSAGIAIFPQHGSARHELLMRADTALYAAKMAGRDRSRVSDCGVD